MSCGSGGCGTTPGGCQSNGSCGTGSCNRMNVHDWLRNLPVLDLDTDCRVVELSFKQGSRKDFYRNSTLQHFEKGDLVTIEGTNGFDVGEVSLTGELVRMQMKKRSVEEFNPEMKKILRAATDRDIEMFKTQKAREPEAIARSRAIARNLKLQMKLSEIEFQADGKKATFFYTADDRIDFRELIKILAGDFKVKVEMRQIGIRQEAGKVGGIGSCGRELCCSTWLTDFKSVTTTAARYQNLSINQTKLSGQCGRLKCCLNYELDTYLDALQYFPDNADTIETTKGVAILIKKDIFRNLMWYVIQGQSTHYPLTINRVKEIKSLNQKGQRPDDLEPVEVSTGKPKEVETGFVDVVGQISLRSLEKNDRSRRDNNRSDRNDRRPESRGPQELRGNRPPAEGSSHRPPQNRDPRPPQNRDARPPQNREARPPREPRPPRNNEPNATPIPPRENRPPKPQSNRPPQNNQPRQGTRGPQNRGPQRPPQNKPPQGPSNN